MPDSNALKSEPLLGKLRRIKCLILDVDGVLTDGRVFWVKETGWTRHYHVKDGFGIKMLMKAGLEVAFLTAGNSQDVKERARALDIPHLYMGSEEKLSAYETLKTKLGFEDEHFAYVADELFDLPVLERVGFSVSVDHAVDAVRSRVDYVTHSRGGFGAVREITDAILEAQEIAPSY